MSEEVEMKGPIFDGKAIKVMNDFVKAVKDEVAKEVNEDVHKRFSQFKNPTGYYESRVSLESNGDNEVVTDHGVVYGSWLEGTSSRNAASSFKGYHSFEKATETAERVAGDVAERLLSQKYLGRLN